MIPYKAATRDKIILSATELGKRMRQTCLELSRLVCYHEIMEKDLCSAIIEDNVYWQKRKSVSKNNKYHSHYNKKNNRNHEAYYYTSDGYKSDGEVNIKHRSATFGTISSEF